LIREISDALKDNIKGGGMYDFAAPEVYSEHPMSQVKFWVADGTMQGGGFFSSIVNRPPLPAPMRRPPASMLGDATDGAEAPSTLQASGGAPPPLAGAKKSLGDPGGPTKCQEMAQNPTRNRSQKTASGPESSFSLNRQAQSLRPAH
jgi:hypothetical protein